jgi:hypothetical protein
MIFLLLVLFGGFGVCTQNYFLNNFPVFACTFFFLQMLVLKQKILFFKVTNGCYVFIFVCLLWFSFDTSFFLQI